MRISIEKLKQQITDHASTFMGLRQIFFLVRVGFGVRGNDAEVASAPKPASVCMRLTF